MTESESAGLQSRISNHPSQESTQRQQMIRWLKRLVTGYADRTADDLVPIESGPNCTDDLSGSEMRPICESGTAKSALEISHSRISNWLDLGFSPLNSPLQSISRPAMACEFEVLLNEGQYASGVERAVEALGHVERTEELFSVYRPQSQFSKLNRFASQRPVHVDALTLELIQLAIDVHQWTNGCFDLTAGSLSETWGFSRRDGKMPTPSQITEALDKVGSQHIEVDESANTVYFTREGLQLNPGGIGKGFALDLAANHLFRSGINDFMIHGGLSSITARGHRNNLNSDWMVGLKHPFRTEELLETIALRNQALGTSGSGKQYFHFGGKRYSHLIDPRTGWPAQQMMSVTVVCPSSGIADALATGLFIMGIDQAIQFCEATPEVAALLIYQDSKSGSQRIDRCNWQLVK